MFECVYACQSAGCVSGGAALSKLAAVLEFFYVLRGRVVVDLNKWPFVIEKQCVSS